MVRRSDQAWRQSLRLGEMGARLGSSADLLKRNSELRPTIRGHTTKAAARAIEIVRLQERKSLLDERGTARAGAAGRLLGGKRNAQGQDQRRQNGRGRGQPVTRTHHAGILPPRGCCDAGRSSSSIASTAQLDAPCLRRLPAEAGVMNFSRLTRPRATSSGFHKSP